MESGESSEGSFSEEYIIGRAVDTQETIRLRIDDIYSPKCEGKCGASRLECYLQLHYCRDWICPTYMICGTGIIRKSREMVGGNCQQCGKELVLYESG